jgi:hypothetical protein
MKFPQALNPETLPKRVPAPMAAVAASCHVRTLDREAKAGRLTQFRRNSRAIYYDRDELLTLIGLGPKAESKAEETSKPSKRRRAATPAR